jgi:hypothetical protein
MLIVSSSLVTEQPGAISIGPRLGLQEEGPAVADVADDGELLVVLRLAKAPAELQERPSMLSMRTSHLGLAELTLGASNYGEDHLIQDSRNSPAGISGTYVPESRPAGQTTRRCLRGRSGGMGVIGLIT